MIGFRVFMKPGGWQVTDGTREHGPYPTYEQAVKSADNLNLHRRAEEERSFAPTAQSNVQGGRSLGQAQHRLTSTISAGDRRDAHLEVKSQGETAAVHGEWPGEPLPPQMVSETKAAGPDEPIGEVRVHEDAPAVWQALEEGASEAQGEENAAAVAAIERARVKGTDSPAAGSASHGGGLV